MTSWPAILPLFGLLFVMKYLISFPFVRHLLRFLFSVSRFFLAELGPLNVDAVVPELSARVGARS